MHLTPPLQKPQRWPPAIPQPEYTLNGRQLYVPLPYSPVFVIDNP